MASRFSLSNCAFRLAILLISLGLGVSALAQESYLVSTQDGRVSMYELATNTFVASAKLSGNSFNMVPSTNPRLAFISVLSAYYSVVDLTLNREVTRIKGVKGSSGTLTPDGSVLLVPDSSFNLNIIDAAQFKVIRSVNLKTVQPQRPGLPGQIVSTSNRAYVFPRSTQAAPNIAVVSLKTYAVSGIPLPAGNVCRNAAR